jgi:hypothetical protein
MTSSLRFGPIPVPILMLVVVAAALAGCASAPPAPNGIAAPPDGLRRLVVVASRDSRFAVDQGSPEGRRPFDEVMKWIPSRGFLVPIAQALYSGITWLLEPDGSSAAPRDVVPAAVVGDAFARSLLAVSPFYQIVVTDREPIGDTRRQADAIVRVAVPAWGLMRVREGGPPVAGAFADVRVEMVIRETGVVVWKYEEDVTHPDRIPLEAFSADRAMTRERLVEVLERAGRRLSTELIYAQNGGGK